MVFYTVEDLRPGMVLSETLYSRTQMLLKAGTALGQKELKILGIWAAKDPRFYGLTDPEVAAFKKYNPKLRPLKHYPLNTNRILSSGKLEEGIYSYGGTPKEPAMEVTVWVIEGLEIDAASFKTGMAKIQTAQPGTVVIWDANGQREASEPLIKYVTDQLYEQLEPKRKAQQDAEKRSVEIHGSVTQKAFVQRYLTAMKALHGQMWPSDQERSPSTAKKWRIKRPLEEALGIVLHNEGFANRLSNYLGNSHFVCDQMFRTSLLSFAIADAAHLPHDVVVQAGIAGLLQDLGMFTTKNERLRIAEKSEPLTQIELRAIEKHPADSRDKIEHLRLGAGIFEGVVQSHERLDGSGYPLRLKGSQIGKLARITSIADTFSAMLSDRPYRPSESVYTATGTLIRKSESELLDPAMINCLLGFLEVFEPGKLVLLSDGMVGKVVEVGSGRAPLQAEVLPLTPTGRAAQDLAHDEKHRILRPLGQAEARARLRCVA